MFKSLFNSFLNLIYNQKCLVCSCAKTDELLCKSCLKDIHYLSTFPQRIFNSTEIYCATIYQTTIKKLIQLLKFSHKKKASKVLANILFEYYKKLELNKDFIIVYPPSFFIKNAQRGYEHMFLIAKEFSELTGFEIYKDLIIKIKPTKPQYKAKNRHLNIKDSFKINQKYIKELKDKNILLIDDITTSGATLEELITCLKNANLNNIICLTISKAGC